MKKLLYMGAGMIVGGMIVTLMYNSKPLSISLRKCKNNMLISLNDYMDDLASLVEEMDEEKMKKRLKAKYNYYKRKIERIDFNNLEEEMKEKIQNLIEEIKSLITKTKEQLEIEA